MYLIIVALRLVRQLAVLPSCGCSAAQPGSYRLVSRVVRLTGSPDKERRFPSGTLFEGGGVSAGSASRVFWH